MNSARSEDRIEAAERVAREAAALLRSRLQVEPRLLIIAGSGLGGIAEAIEVDVEISFEELPGHPSTGVVGHAGRYLAGRMEGVPVLLQLGRYHLYEGHRRETVALPVRTAVESGMEGVILTNATGGIRPDLCPGSIVLLEECLDFQGSDPLYPRTIPFDTQLRALAAKAGESAGISLATGRYAAVLGPAFETPAEIQMLARFGADLVGMSTAVELEAANAAGVPVLGISLVTNRAAGTSATPPDHAEVLATGAGAAGRMAALLGAIVRGTR